MLGSVISKEVVALTEPSAPRYSSQERVKRLFSEPIIEIEDGIYLGENKIVQPNHHILLSSKIYKNTTIKWLFRLIK